MTTTKRRPAKKTAAKKRPRKRQPPKPPTDELAGAAPAREQCTAETAKGEQCKRLAVDGGDLCAVHAGAPVGRPVKLSDKVTALICEILRAGGYVETAAQVAGISKATYHDWIKRGDPAGKAKADAPYREFRDQVDQARAEGEAILIARVAKGAEKDWRAAAWMLERQHPERWAGPRGRALVVGSPDEPPGGGALTDPDGAPVVVDDQTGPDGSPL